MGTMIYRKVVWVTSDSNLGVNKKNSALREEWVNPSFRSKKKNIIKDLKARYRFPGRQAIYYSNKISVRLYCEDLSMDYCMAICLGRWQNITI